MDFQILDAITPLLYTATSGTGLLAIVAVTIVLPFLLNALTGNGMVRSIPIIGIRRNAFTQVPARFKYLTHGRELLFGAMNKLKSIFQIVTLHGPMIILSGTYTDDIRNNKKCSHYEFFQRTFFTTYPGFEASKRRTPSNVLKDAVRTKLTQSLGPVSLDLCRCADREVDEIFGLSEQWQQWNVRKHTQELVAKLSTQVFLGERLIKNKEWIRVAVDYTIHIVLAVMELRLTPAPLRPIIHWFLPNCCRLRKDRTSGRKIIDEEIRIRQQEREAAAARGEPPSKTSDSIGWFTEIADGQPIDMSGMQLSLTLAAIHTTSDMISKSLYYLAADPQLRQAIREEIVDALTTQGWRKSAVTGMKLLDSMMKEIQRIHAPACSKCEAMKFSKGMTQLTGLSVSLRRWTQTDVTLHDGTKIPKGSMIGVLHDKHFDPTVYERPEEFDAWRYIKLAEKTGDRNHWLFVTTSPDHIGFGHGVHACPGRFFAANEIKIALTFMLLRYDWRVPDIEQRLKEGKSPVVNVGDSCYLDPKIKIEFKRRTPEIDIMSYT